MLVFVLSLFFLVRGKRIRRAPRFERDEIITRDDFVLPNNLKAGGGPGMYGIAGPSYEDGYAALVQYNINNGSTTTIAQPDQNPVLTGESLGCLDNVHNVFFFIYEGYNKEKDLISGLYPYDLANPSTQYTPIYLESIYPDPFVGAGDECTSDPNTGDIYVFGHDNNNLDYQLLLRVVFDPTKDSATITQVANYSLIDDIPLLAGQATIYDSKRDYMWIVGEDGNNTNNFTVNYFYINAKTGTIDNTISFFDVPIDTALYNPSLDVIVGLTLAGQNSNGYYTFSMVHLDPITLEIRKTFPAFDNNYCAWEAIYSQDVSGGVYYGLLYKVPGEEACSMYNGTFLGHLVGVFVNNGSVRAEPQFCEFGIVLSCPWELQYWDGSS